MSIENPDFNSEEEKSKEIEDAETFYQLYEILREKGGIKGSRKTYNAEDLIKEMEDIRVFAKETDIVNVTNQVSTEATAKITRTDGLRSKFLTLIYRELNEKDLRNKEQSEKIRDFKKELKREITPEKITEAIREVEGKFDQPDKLKLETKKLLKKFQDIQDEIEDLNSEAATLTRQFEAMPSSSKIWQNLKALVGIKSDNIKERWLAEEKSNVLLKESKQILEKIMRLENLSEDQLMALAEKLDKGDIEI